MGFLKNLLVEEVPQEQEMYVNDSSYEYEESEEVVTEGVTQENLLSDIYMQNDKSDMSKSIFKVEELINSLPKEMPTDIKKATVLSILTSFGLTVDEVVADGLERCTIITNALQAIVNDNNSVIINNESAIEQKKIEIQELEKDNAERSAVIKNTEDKVDVEIKRIETLIKFVGGVC